jgi:DNA adenine methylase
VNRGGILARGAGLIKYGEKSKGLGSRWYPTTLAKRIREIGGIRERLTFIHGDGSTVITQYSERDNAVFFVDPPYTAGNGKRAGSRLYNHSELDHEKLFQVMESVNGDFLLTYDNAAEVQAMAVRHGFDVQPVAMKSTHHAEMTELLIGRSLEWARK